MDEKKSIPASYSGLYFMILMLVMFVILIPEIRDALAIGVGFIFTPLLGFNGQFPILTIVFAALLLTIINMYARHYFIDWFEMAKLQEKTRFISKKMREAYRARDMGKIEKYRKVQQKLMMDQMKSQQDQMKPMIITIVIVIAIFTWLYYFLSHAPVKTFNTPWAFNIDITGGISLFPNWLILYTFFTFPLGYFITYLFKIYEFHKRLKQL
ncbi:MAG: EMC3/TMCO1 family protein [Thermoplasmata archaeon]